MISMDESSMRRVSSRQFTVVHRLDLQDRINGQVYREEFKPSQSTSLWDPHTLRMHCRFNNSATDNDLA